MKSTSFLLIAGALALASCSQDEPVSISQGHAVSFRPAIGTASRASETTNANLSEINVTAIMGDTTFFHDLNYTKGSDGFFNSSIPYYWPEDNTPLTFYAYSPSADELGADFTINSKTQKLESYFVDTDIANQKDFITAVGTGSKEANEATGLELNFGHRLAQIELRAKADNPGYNFKVAGMIIGRPQLGGSYDFAKNEWTLDEWHDTDVLTSYCTPVDLTSTPVSIMGESGNAMLIPQTLVEWNHTGDPDNAARGAYLSVYVQITTKDGARVYPVPSDSTIDSRTGKPREYAWAAIPLSGTWEQGKKYVYTLDFSHGGGYTDPDDPLGPGLPILGDPIKFTTQVSDWDETDIPISYPAK